MSNLGDVKKKLNAAQANAYGAAEDYDNLPMQLRPSLDPSYLPGGVNTRKETVAPSWAKPVDVSDPKDLAILPQGQAYRIRSGPYAARSTTKDSGMTGRRTEQANERSLGEHSRPWRPTAAAPVASGSGACCSVHPRRGPLA